MQAKMEKIETKNNQQHSLLSSEDGELKKEVNDLANKTTTLGKEIDEQHKQIQKIQSKF